MSVSFLCLYFVVTAVISNIKVMWPFSEKDISLSATFILSYSVHIFFFKTLNYITNLLSPNVIFVQPSVKSTLRFEFTCNFVCESKNIKGDENRNCDYLDFYLDQNCFWHRQTFIIPLSLLTSLKQNCDQNFSFLVIVFTVIQYLDYKVSTLTKQLLITQQNTEHILLLQIEMVWFLCKLNIEKTKTRKFRDPLNRELLSLAFLFFTFFLWCCWHCGNKIYIKLHGQSLEITSAHSTKFL